MSRKKEFDPNAIPNYGGAGRVGEIDPNEPEEQMSSAQVAGSDPDVRTDPAAGEAPPDPEDARVGDDRPTRASTADAVRTDPGKPAAAPRQPLPAEERPRTIRDDRARGQTHNPTDNPEPVTQGPGAIDGLVGAP
jgi:hypothetical protein